MDINLSTTVNNLLNEYPELQQVLIDLDPKFEKLKNPILRKSIARVATLEQASVIANIPYQPSQKSRGPSAHRPFQ